MLNKTIENMKSNSDFTLFIQNNFKKPVELKYVNNNYFERIMPDNELERIEDHEQRDRIIERYLIRDNIYKKYKFDIFEYPFIVFYEDQRGKKIKKFKIHDEANKFSESLLQSGVYSLLIAIMNYDIECIAFK